MIFAESGYLFLLLLIPVFIIVQTVVLRFRRKRMEKFGDEALVKKLMPSYSRAKVWLRLSFFLLAFFFFVIGISRPQMGAILKEHKTRGAEVMIVLDVSNSMLAEDYSPNRLERAKLAISRVVDKLRDDRIGLVVFAGNSFVQLPITTDYVSAKMFLGSISTESIPIQGTAIGDAISTALRSFSSQSDRSRAIIVITDGENHEDDAIAAAKQAQELGIQVFVVGIGKPEGSPIPMPGTNDYFKDRSGQVVVSRLNEEMCQQVAQAGKGIYVRCDNTNTAMRALQQELEKIATAELESTVYADYNEQYQSFVLLALLLLVIEFFIMSRKNHRLHRMDLFKESEN